jgi:hypothetical protein
MQEELLKKLREQKNVFIKIKKRDRKHKIAHVRFFHSHVTNEEVIVAFGM